MEVAKACWIEGTPYTLFSLDATEQERYASFRKRHSGLEGCIQGLKMQERRLREHEVQEDFKEIINPYLKQCGLEIATCFAGYGKEKRTHVQTPHYKLSNQGDTIGHVDFWFDEQENTLASKAILVLNTDRDMFDDTFKMIVGKKVQDGSNVPLLSFQGNGIYVASTECISPLFGLMRDVIGALDSAFKEIRLLHQEYIAHKGNEHYKIQARVFKEAYEKRLREALTEAGFIKQVHGLN